MTAPVLDPGWRSDWLTTLTPAGPDSGRGQGPQGSRSPRTVTVNVRDAAGAARAFGRVVAVQDLVPGTSVSPPAVREVAAPIMPVRPNPNLIDKIEQRTNGAGAQPDSSPAAAPTQPAQPTPTAPKSIDPRAAVMFPGLYNPDGTPAAPTQPAPADPTAPKSIDPHLAFIFPSLYNPDGTPLAPGQAPTVPQQPATKFLIPGISLAPQAPVSHEGTVEADGTTYPAQIVVASTLVTFAGVPEPVTVTTTRATVNQPHPLFGGTGWTATFDNDQHIARIDITSPTTGIAAITTSGTGLQITNTSGTTLTVNAHGVPEGPFENPATGEKGTAQPLPGGGYRTTSTNGAITDYNANGDVVNHLPAPNTGDHGWWATTGDFVKNAIASTLGNAQHSITHLGAGLGAAASGGTLTPQGQAYLQAAAVDPAHDPTTAWRQWLDTLTIKGTLSAAGNLVAGAFAMTDIGAVINSGAQAFDLHPDLPTSDTIGQAMGDNAKAAKTEFDKGNLPGGLNHLGMATGLLPDFSDPNSVLVWAATLGLGKTATGRAGTPEPPLPTPVKPLPTPKTLGPGASHPAATSPAVSMKVVLDAQPQLTPFDLATSRAQQGLDLAQLPRHTAAIRAAEKDLVTGVEQHLQLHAEISQPNTTPAMAHTGPGGTPSHPQGPAPRGIENNPNLTAGRDNSGTSHKPPSSDGGSSNAGRSTPDRGLESNALGPDRDGHFPADIDTPGVRQAFDDLQDRTSGATRGFALDAATDQRIPYPYGKNPDDAIVSDQKAPWTRAQELIKKMPFWRRYGNTTPKFAADVEMKAAIVARDLRIKNLKIVINNASGPCRLGCHLALPYLVDPEGSITVIYPGGYRIYKGSKFKES
ncbi:DddA-like double-stranded DNA deaminase toxin [Nocardia sp. NPDC051981]|uniref:DddA-like double-stranded DNA deaminase toxin n=1 Tax=Nocardia sp. NPDC051981 TaxID=3155417 RepID=UPI003420D0A4